MSRIEAALTRFSAALDTLEQSLGARLAMAKDSANVAAELALLRIERDRLAARVATLEEEARILGGVTEEVEDRLDGAIAEIREALTRN
jgi:cell division protein FtsB